MMYRVIFTWFKNFFLMYQLFVIFYYSGVYFVKIFKPLRLILIQYLNEKFGTHEMF